MNIIKTKKNTTVLQLNNRQLSIIAHNLHLQIYDLESVNNEDYEEGEKIDKKAIQKDCEIILGELQKIKIWGNLPKLNEMENCEMCEEGITKEELKNSDICNECLNELN